MPSKSFIGWVLVGTLLALVTPIVGSIISEFYFPNWLFSHVPFHSLVEAVGGLMAIAIASILIAERPRQTESEHFIWVASALMGMGALDLFHAGVFPGQNFVWLHSTATFVGGVLFALVWLPAGLSRSRFMSMFPWIVLGMTTILGIASCLMLPLPQMVFEGKFTLLARGLNIGGGIGFFIAATFFLMRFKRQEDKADWLFAVHTALFGAAGVLFELSSLWDAAWWWWHLLRLVAYLAALTYAVQAFMDAERMLFASHRELTDLNRQLDRQVEERTVELRVSEERFALAVQGSTDGLWDWNILTDEVYFAPRFRELLGYCGEEFPNIFASFETHLHPDDRQGTLSALQEHLQNHTNYDVQYRLRTKSDEYRWFRARGQALWDENQNPVRMAGSITDVTAQKQAEKSLIHERFLFKTLMDHLPDAIYFKDTAGKFIRVAAALVKKVGAKNADELIGKSDVDFFPAEFAEQTLADEKHLMETGESIVGKEEKPVWHDQGECWVSTTRVPLRDEDGTIIGTFGISHDITEQKLAQERFRRLIEATPNALIVVGNDGLIQSVNKATEEMFGFTREELIGQNVEMLVPSEFREQQSRDHAQYFENPESRSSGRPLQGLRKDETEFPTEIGLSPINLDGQTLLLISVNDQTAHKDAENALISAKEAAESANRAKSDFLANMSHEIRTPMNAVIGMTELVLDSDLNHTQRNFLTIVQESAESLLSIINQILDFSKIEAGRLELDVRVFDLREEICDTLKTLAHRAHAKNIELAWNIDQDVPQYLIGDEVRFRQILLNLVGNAIKFTSEGEVVVRIGMESCQENHVNLKFTISDTGIGIAESQLDTVFAPFEQADNSTTREFGGTGLGLTITSHLIEAMDGRIWVESQQGKGTQFHFVIKFQIGGKPEKQQDRFDSDLADLPILVVDDNATNRLILVEMLEAWGMTVLVATGAVHGLEVLESWLSQGKEMPLLLSDVNMPEIDGFEFAGMVRSNDRSKDIEIIFLTSAGRPGDIQRCKDLGVRFHMMKPIKQSELLDALTQASGRTAKTINTDKTDELPVLPKLNILLAEDGKANQVLAKSLLEKWGHDVDIVDDGEKALNSCQDKKYDLILMDVQMPVKDGLAATREIRMREIETGEHLPIVAMTARAMKGDREECLQAGMDDYVAKPIRRDELMIALSRLFGDNKIAGMDEPGMIEGVNQTNSLIPWDLAIKNTAGDPVMLRAIVQSASEELPEQLDAINKSLEADDLVALARIAHTLKSTAQIFAAEKPANAAASLEQAARDRNIPLVEISSIRVKEQLVRLLQELKTRLEQDDE